MITRYPKLEMPELVPFLNLKLLQEVREIMYPQAKPMNRAVENRGKYSISGAFLVLTKRMRRALVASHSRH